MTDLLLREGEQVALRAVIATDPVPGGAMPGEMVLGHVARLIECDAIGLALLDGSGSAVEETALGRGRRLPGDRPARAGPVALGIQCRGRGPTRAGAPAPRGVAVLTYGVRNGPDHVVKLWMIRRTSDFSDRDRALLGLVAPALERLLRERPTSTRSSLTAQERRVLQHVAEGLSNAEIAERLVVAPSTVRKHLENAYRKLGVSNRLAALRALEGDRTGEPDEAVDRVVALA